MSDHSEMDAFGAHPVHFPPITVQIPDIRALRDAVLLAYTVDGASKKNIVDACARAVERILEGVDGGPRARYFAAINVPRQLRGWPPIRDFVTRNDEILYRRLRGESAKRLAEEFKVTDSVIYALEAKAKRQARQLGVSA